MQKKVPLDQSTFINPKSFSRKSLEVIASRLLFKKKKKTDEQTQLSVHMSTCLCTCGHMHVFCRALFLILY